jgi:hypothetical protein
MRDIMKIANDQPSDISGEEVDYLLKSTLIKVVDSIEKGRLTFSESADRKTLLTMLALILTLSVSGIAR